MTRVSGATTAPLGFAALWEGLLAFGRISRVAFRDAYGWLNPMIYANFLLIRPIAQVVFFGLVARFATGRADVSFQLIGNAVQVCALSSLHTVADVLISERAHGTLPLITLAARNRFLLFGGRLLVVGLHGLVTSVVALAVAVVGFGMSVGEAHWGALALALLAAVLATSGLGVALGSAGLVLTDLNLLGNIVTSALLVLCGINFPVTALPGWLQVVAYMLPMTRGAQAARLAMAGAVGTEYAHLVVGEALVGLAWLLAGYGLYLFLERQAVRRGTLDLY